MINVNPNMPPVTNTNSMQPPKIEGAGRDKADFSEAVNAVGKYISNVDQSQKASDMSITDLLTGRNEDIVSVVSEVAKADMSFKLLVGVRNKLIEAYKQTMNMPL